MISEDTIGQLLLDADNRAARPPVLNAQAVLAAVRHRQAQFKTRRLLFTACSSIAAAILIAGLIWMQHDRNKQFQIVQLQNQIETLNRRLDTTMAMVQETLEVQRRQEKLVQLESQLARYGEDDEKLRTQEENTALTILIQADRLQQANLRGDAETFYKRIVDMYPDTYWAQIARQKLEPVQSDTDKKGNTL